MQAQLQQRLKSLKTEYEAGQKVLANLQAQQDSLRETLLRISGAIQVLEEELTLARQSEQNRDNGRPPEPLFTVASTAAVEVDAERGTG